LHAQGETRFKNCPARKDADFLGVTKGIGERA